MNAWQVTAGSLPLYMAIVVSLFEDNQDHQVVIDPSLVAHLGTCACKQSEILKNSIIIILYLTKCHLGAESLFKRECETNYKY